MNPILDSEQTKAPVTEAGSIPPQTVEQQTPAQTHEEQAPQATSPAPDENQPKAETEENKETQQGETVRILTYDGHVLEVPLSIARCSQTWKNLRDDLGEKLEEAIPCERVSTHIMHKIIHWCAHYHQHEAVINGEKMDDSPEYRGASIPDFDSKFFESQTKEEWLDIAVAANYLDIKLLLDNTCKFIAWKIKHYTPEQLREFFNLPNDFTPEEEDQIRRENEWAEQ